MGGRGAPSIWGSRKSILRSATSICERMWSSVNLGLVELDSVERSALREASSAGDEALPVLENRFGLPAILGACGALDLEVAASFHFISSDKFFFSAYESCYHIGTVHGSAWLTIFMLHVVLALFNYYDAIYVALHINCYLTAFY
uniref:Uncharacterized protein n=1 Tax=Arundo donax TaxID=35708 RepID=A0A0A9D3E3_ARUDO